jgi:hypothetical protein
MLADEKCLRQFVMSEMLSQAIMLNQDELLPHGGSILKFAHGIKRRDFLAVFRQLSSRLLGPALLALGSTAELNL